MTQNTFKVGDKIICVNAALYGYVPGLTNGKEYTVKEPSNNGDIMVEGFYHSLSPRRFAPVAPATLAPVVLKKLQPLPARILKHLEKKKTISPVEAFAAYGTTRLAAAIFQLRKAGYSINTELKNDNVGHPYARYWLAA